MSNAYKRASGIQVMLLPLSDITLGDLYRGDFIAAGEQMTVMRTKSGFSLVSGGERLMSLIAEGRTFAEALVLPEEKEEAWQTMLERLRSKRLPYLDEARLMKRLVSDYGFTVKALAMSLGRSQSTVGQRLRLMRYTGEEQALIERGALPEWQAQKLLSIPSREARAKCLSVLSSRLHTPAQVGALIKSTLLSLSLPIPACTGLQRYIIRDARLYVNALRSIAAEMQEAGLPVSFLTSVFESTCEVRITMPRLNMKVQTQ